MSKEDFAKGLNRGFAILLLAIAICSFFFMVGVKHDDTLLIVFNSILVVTLSVACWANRYAYRITLDEIEHARRWPNQGKN